MNQDSQPPAILALGTAIPPYFASQETIAHWMAASFQDQPRVQRWLKRIYTHTGIEKRHSCVPHYRESPQVSRLAPGQLPAHTLSTSERMAIYRQESVPLGTQAARLALAEYAKAANLPFTAARETVTHLIVVSCTGFFAPGLDLAIAQELKLAPTVARTLIGFMGCAAAFNGLQAATHIVNSQPAARVLVVCVELCSLHIQPGSERENLLSAALFADGAAACLVGKPQPWETDFFTIKGFHTKIQPDTETEMMWQIGDHGFTLRLSPQIPRYLGQIAPAALEQLVGRHTRPDFWAIHPGGKAIVDHLAYIFALEPEQVQASRAVLRRVGNLSSATIFFVLAELRQQLRQQLGQGEPEKIDINGVAMAFGPGLVIEMAHLAYKPPAHRIKMEIPHHETALA